MGALVDGPEPDEFADFGSVLLPGRRAFRPSGLFVADGGSECPEGPCCAVGFARSCWEAGCSSAWRSRPRLSLGFPRVPFLFLRGVCLGAGVERRPPKRGVYAGQRAVALVGVTGFEPAASSSRTTSEVAVKGR